MAKVAAPVRQVMPKPPWNTRLRAWPKSVWRSLHKYWFIYLLALPD